MDLKKLSPSMLLALGLVSCDDGEGTSTTSTSTTTMSSESEAEVGPCLTPLPNTDDAGSESGLVDTGQSTGMGSSTGTGGETSTGPCLSPPEESTGTDSGTGGSGTDSGGSTGGMEAAPFDRAAALQRLIDRGALPSDVAARLRTDRSED